MLGAAIVFASLGYIAYLLWFAFAAWQAEAAIKWLFLGGEIRAPRWHATSNFTALPAPA